MITKFIYNFSSLLSTHILISTMTSSIEMQNDVKAELQQYLKDNDINTIFVSIVEKLLINKPVEPVGFIVKYLIVSSYFHTI